MKIYDNLGILRFQRKYNQQQTATLDVSGLKEGAYIVEINTGGNKLEHQKLVIKK